MGTDTAEKTPTTNGILTDAGEIAAMANELSIRAQERLAIKPSCPMASSVAGFAGKVAKHIHKTDTQICDDHSSIVSIKADLSFIKKCASWTLGLVVASIGTGGMWQLFQWGIALIKKLPIAILLSIAAGCQVRAYPPLDANGQPTAMPVVVVSEANPPANPMSWWEMLLAVGGGLLGVQTLGMGGRGGIAVARKLAGTVARKASGKP